MSGDVVQTIGRGGAGNFYTKKDLDLALAPQQDIEAQRPSGSSQPRETLPQSSGYIRSGRGGAGNFITSSDHLPTSSGDTSPKLGGTDPLESVKEQVKDRASRRKSGAHHGLSGRGGVGNWRQASGEEERMIAEEEIKFRNELDEFVRLDVETSLKPPPKAYTAPETVDATPI